MFGTSPCWSGNGFSFDNLAWVLKTNSKNNKTTTRLLLCVCVRSDRGKTTRHAAVFHLSQSMLMGCRWTVEGGAAASMDPGRPGSGLPAGGTPRSYMG